MHFYEYAVNSFQLNMYDKPYNSLFLKWKNEYFTFQQWNEKLVFLQWKCTVQIFVHSFISDKKIEMVIVPRETERVKKNN